jgi:hypothetical protein
MRASSFWCGSVAVFAIAACRPDIDEPASAVSAARVLAVKAEPPEAAPGAAVSAHALVASGQGTLTDAPLDWALCTTPKSPAEDRTVNPACLRDLPSVGDGVDAAFAVPDDACALFGPEAPPGEFRPRDPDSTGGYFQPVRVRLGDADSVALERLLCNPRNAEASVAAEFLHDYRPNRNPSLHPVEAAAGARPTDLERVPGGTRLRFTASWEPDDDEEYLRFEPSSQAIAWDHEVLRVSWYATAGAFATDRTGEDASRAAASANDWTAPPSAGPVHFWVVVRDSRGGQDFASWDAVVVER